MKISVAMCTYNGERYLREQLESIGAQTRLPDELVVCDDQSADATLKIISDFAATAGFPVLVHVNEQNLGSTKNFEWAIRYSTGDIIALADQDDVWHETKLQRLETEFMRAPNVGLVFTDADVIDQDTRSLGYTLWEKLPLGPEERQRLRTGKAIDGLLERATVTGATVAFRARFKDLILPIPNNLAIIHDAWITILVAAVSEILPLAEPLIKYRLHGDQQVGAKARMEDDGGIMKAMQRKTFYAELIEIGMQVQQRLWEYRAIYKSDVALYTLEARLRHLRTRSHLPQARLSRLRCVIGELLSRRYHTYSNGFRSALKDLLA
jgi:glycosyltransferase involved in cell wall biosynthesis